jgi:hypothetical protein
MSTLKTNTIQHLTSGFNNIVTHTDGAGTVNAAHCRAWVNFNGTGTVAINAQFNVSSITDNGTGDYTVNFSNAMSDANYCVAGNCSFNPTGTTLQSVFPGSRTATTARVTTVGSAYYDNDYVSISIFR